MSFKYFSIMQITGKNLVCTISCIPPAEPDILTSLQAVDTA